MTHIFFFTENDRSSVYGRGTYLKQMITCLQDVKNISLHIVEFFTQESEFQITKEENFSVYSFPAQNNSSFLLFKYYHNCWYILKSYMEIEENDKIIFHLNFLKEYELVKYMKEDFPSCKVIFTLHYQHWASLLNGDLSLYKKILKKQEEKPDDKFEEVYSNYLAEKRVFDGVDHIICLSEFTAELLKNSYHIPQNKIVIIHNGLEHNFPNISREEKEKTRKKLWIEKKEKIILFVGRLDATKGINLLIQAFEKVLQTDPDCRLVIIGDGDFPACFQKTKTCWSKITFTGRLKKEELYEFYQIADVAALPSVHEQCSYVAIEMMGFGLPIVSSPGYGLLEMIQSYENAKIVSIKRDDGEEYLSLEELSRNLIDSISVTNRKGQIPDRYQLKNIQKIYFSL
ncbi:MAG: TIGR04157 family glycosyltransferase [Tannerellaceae bacterium]|nr:TIGR04157 family glycosyltransferase [Tannerellaceae bacterium]